MIDEPGNKRGQRKNGQDWYEIQLEGHFHSSWFSGLEDWEIMHLPNGNTLLSGPVIDQPALHGIIARIRDLNLTIVSINKSIHPKSDEIQEMKEAEGGA
jgi:hypothetical protein